MAKRPEYSGRFVLLYASALVIFHIDFGKFFFAVDIRLIVFHRIAEAQTVTAYTAGATVAKP